MGKDGAVDGAVEGGLDEVADELYAGALGDFIPHRDTWAKQARAAGDRDLSAAVSALRKPTVSAWLANLLAHQQPEQVRQLIELGAALREAQSVLDPDQLRALGRQRYQVVAELVALARRRAAELGQRTGDAAATELEGTLGAALSDPDAAAALVQGRLTQSLVYAGFGETGATATKAAPARPAAQKAPVPSAGRPAKPDHAERIDAAERALTQARLQAAEAADDAERATQDADQLQAQVTEAETQVADLTDALSAAKQALTTARTAHVAARKEQVRRADVARRAEERAEQAARAVTSLRKS